MESSLRSTPAVIARIERLRDDLIKRFESLVGLAALERADRNSTAATQYLIKVETAGLIRAAEDIQVFIRQLQEMWLFGQLNTIGDGTVQQQTNENAKAVSDLLAQLAGYQNLDAANIDPIVNEAVTTNGS